MATIQRREQTPGKITYRVRWWADGTQRSKTFTGQAEARRFKAVLEGDLVNGTWLDPQNGSQTLSGFVTEWFPTVHDLRPTSKEQLRSCVYNHVLPEFGNLPLSAIGHQHVQVWTGHMVPRMAASTVRKNVFALRRIMQAAQRAGFVRSDPTVGISLPSPSKAEQRFLTKSQIETLAVCVRPRYRAMILVAAFGGFRFGELCALKRENVDVLRSTIRIKETLVDINGAVSFGPPKTKTSLRTVTIPRTVMNELVTHMNDYCESLPSSLVFTFSNGAPIRRSWFRQRVWLGCTKKAGLEGLRFHDLRHTFVALWVSLGRNAKEVSKVAGHSSVAFTLDRYGHLYDTDDSGLADSLDQMLA